jgi:hypothetical protein
MRFNGATELALAGRGRCVIISAVTGLLLGCFSNGVHAQAPPSAASLCTQTSPPVLKTEGPRFSIDGRPRFVVLASYFDAMRARPAELESDLAFLKSKGVGGIRIFPLWVYQDQSQDATLLDADGRVRSPARWDHFTNVLSAAARCGLIVDVTFNREQLENVSPPFSVAEYAGDPEKTTCRGGGGDAGGITEVACRLKRAGTFPHVFFDLQNEAGKSDEMKLSNGDARRIRDAIKSIDPDRLVMVSALGGAQTSLDVARSAALDAIAFHESQEKDWYEATAANVRALLAAGRPVYLQEMARAPDRGVTCFDARGEPNPFLEAVRMARDAGAAAWTFHTGAAFRLDIRRFQSELSVCKAEKDFLDGLKGILQ